MTQNRIENQTITETVEAEGLIMAPTVGTWQPDYGLSEADFVRLRTGKPVTYNWANSILLTTFGFGLSLFAKAYPSIMNNDIKSPVTEGEWITLGVGLGITGLLYLIGTTMPDERKKVLKDIEAHFQSAPKSKHVRSAK
ncbi:hypothetical protein [Photobacterium rosenbergii]|uniref:hypothetical protein n=1 Tax=Photobacterium rosenbergii TaxID=294936 RepID=UPI001C994D9C|nr:hypothetical protein [Photobacterium rosenbergii]MBY5948274.1 hypothetical protein [Photobacterium rosenbergii]